MKNEHNGDMATMILAVLVVLLLYAPVLFEVLALVPQSSVPPGVAARRTLGEPQSLVPPGAAVTMS